MHLGSYSYDSANDFATKDPATNGSKEARKAGRSLAWRASFNPALSSFRDRAGGTIVLCVLLISVK